MVVLVPAEEVSAEREEKPPTVVQLVLAVRVENELERHVDQLPHPSDLGWPSQAGTLCVVHEGKRDVYHAHARGGRGAYRLHDARCRRRERTDRRRHE